MWVKVCGVRDRAAAVKIAELGADAIGLNFYSRSPRFVEPEIAVEIAQALPEGVERIGVFVNHPIRNIERIAAECHLDVLQLHGDEPPSYLADLQRRLPGIRTVRAWRMAKNLDGLGAYLKECRQWNCELAGCLVDAQVDGSYGGSGKTVPWERLVREYRFDKWPPLILAGGLTATNVADAISVAHPWGVDVASGVESSPGVKDLALVEQFVRQAKSTADTPIASESAAESAPNSGTKGHQPPE